MSGFGADGIDSADSADGTDRTDVSGAPYCNNEGMITSEMSCCHFLCEYVFIYK